MLFSSLKLKTFQVILSILPISLLLSFPLHAETLAASGNEPVSVTHEGLSSKNDGAKSDGTKIDGAKSDGAKTDELPAYGFHYNNGLYATLVGYFGLKDIELRNQQTLKLNVPSFRKKVLVKAIIQSEPAPLVVVLLGLDGKADGRLGKLWPSWFSEAGYHVLSFDSTFSPSFIDMSGHGVTGNLNAESERISEIIGTFLDLDELKGKVSKIGIVGMSYGGLETLVLAEMAKDGKLKFKLDAAQAYSPPIAIEKTGMMIDRWHDEDRWHYTLADLSTRLSGHKPVSADEPVPFSDSLMRAAISAVFRLGLADVVVQNDKEFKLNALPSGDMDDEYVKRDYAETWGYYRFMTEMCFPYWKKKLNLKNFQELFEPVALPALLQKQPSYSETVIAADDPFDTPEDIAALKSGPGLTILVRGGHLGFVADPWTKAKLLTLFKSAPKQAAK